jgi:hypothetical protein
MPDRPEIVMIRRAVPPALGALVVASLGAGVLAGRGAAVSAALGVVIVFANFVAHGLSLAWASTVSISALRSVALLGVIIRLSAIFALMILLDSFGWFSATAFALTVAPATVLLLIFEARLLTHGVGAALQIPADPIAVRAAQSLMLTEAR